MPIPLTNYIVPFPTIVFFIIALVIVGTASVVAFSKNIVVSAFALLGTLAGTAALYVFLHADFLAATTASAD